MPLLGPHHAIVLLGLPVLAYLLGAIPWGLIFTRIFAHVDIRTKGSGNIGATNVMRQAGLIAGVLTLAGDVLKGAIAVYLAVWATGPASGLSDIYLSAVALAAFWGHLFPVYLKFRDGGKGVATAAGCFAALSALAVLAALLVFIVMVVGFRRVSVGSLSAATTLPLALWLTTGSGSMTAAGAIAAFFIFIRHRDNLKRLVAGTEPKFKLKKNHS
jgi:glycerol-3-phosphate acyltransferase PlsY